MQICTGSVSKPIAGVCMLLHMVTDPMHCLIPYLSFIIILLMGMAIICPRKDS